VPSARSAAMHRRSHSIGISRGGSVSQSPVEIGLSRLLDRDAHHVPGLQPPRISDVDGTVDLRCIGVTANAVRPVLWGDDQ